ARAREEVAREIEAIHGAQQLVVDVCEVELDLARQKLLAFADVDPTVDDAPDRVAGRRDRATDVQQVVPQRRDAAPDLRCRPVLDPVLELVYLVVESVYEIEEVLGDQIGEPVDHQPDGRIRLLRHGLPRGLEVERMAPLGGLAYGQEPVARRDDVYLLVEDPVLLADRDRDEEDAEDVVVVA